MRRLCMELAGHYRNLMLCALPGGTSLLTGISPEEESAYTQRKDFRDRSYPRHQRLWLSALEKMSRGTDQRIELELAVFSLTQPEAAAQVVIQQAAPVPAAPQAFASAPRAAITAAPPVQAAHLPLCRRWFRRHSRPWQPPQQGRQTYRRPSTTSRRLQPELKPVPQPVSPPTRPAPAGTLQIGTRPGRSAQPFGFWPAVLSDLEENDAMSHLTLRGTRAYCDGKRVLFECSDAPRLHPQQS